MKLKAYRDDLLKRLEDRRCAAEFLEQTLATGDTQAFLIALKDVIDAGGGVGKLASQVRITRPSLYKILSEDGNPTLESLRKILKPLGLRVAIALDEAA